MENSSLPKIVDIAAGSDFNFCNATVYNFLVIATTNKYILSNSLRNTQKVSKVHSTEQNNFNFGMFSLTRCQAHGSYNEACA